jgi:hypothetical protein
MHSSQLAKQSSLYFSLAARFAADFLYYGHQNLQTANNFKYYLNLGMRSYQDATHYDPTSNVDLFVANTLGDVGYKDIATMLAT